MVEFPIVPLPKVWCAAIACEHSAFNHRQLVMRRDNSPLPFHVAGREGERHRMALQELTEIGYLFEVFRRNWRHLKASRTLRDDQALGGQPA